jgi:hypothetical protein
MIISRISLMTMRFVLGLILSCIALTVYAQDKVYLSNGDVLIGEVKSLTQGVLTAETDYSDSDFKIEWEEVKSMHSVSYFRITLTTGEVLSGRFIRDTVNPKDGFVTISVPFLENRQVAIEDVAFFQDYEEDFWSRFKASIDLGFNYTRASNLSQFTARATLGYRSDKWSAGILYNQLQSSQTNVDDIRRTELQNNFNYYLPNDFFVQGQVNFLSNTEQALELRSMALGGLGHYFFRSQSSDLTAGTGLAAVSETYTQSEGADNPAQQSIEYYVGLEWHIWDWGDLSFLIRNITFFGLTERGRIRSDARVDFKYDLPYDFYISANGSLNYDNPT